MREITMQLFEQILEEARRLPPDERKRLIDQLESDLRGENEASVIGAGLDSLLALAGTGHSEYADVSSDKYRHLAEVYANKQ